MKKLFVLLLSILSLLLVSCTNDKLGIHVKIDFNQNKIESINPNLSSSLSVNDSDFRLNINISSLNEELPLYVNGKFIDKDKYIIENNVIKYTFYADEFLDPETIMHTKIYLDTNGGVYDKTYLSNLTPHSTFDVTVSNDSENQDSFVLFSNEETGLRWHYKLFLKYDESLSIYKVVYLDKYTATIDALNLPSYDYVLALHYQSKLFTELSLFEVFNESNGHVIVTDKLISLDNTPNTFNLYTPKTYKNTVILNLYNESITLPKVSQDEFEFDGWMHSNTLYNEVKPIKAKDRINILRLTANWKGYSVDKLKTHLESLLPETVEGNLVLPTKYSDYEITYRSSDTSILTNEGIFKNSYGPESIVLTAIAKNSSDETFEISMNLKLKPKKSLSGKTIASSYIYRGYDTVNDFFFEALDIINASFVLADSNGDFTNLSYFQNVLNYIMPGAKKSGSRVIMVVGPSSEWSDIALSNSRIENFANNIVKAINEYGFDGVDIDWEYPRTNSESTAFVKMMEVIYTKVKENNPNHLVTAAIAGGIYQPPRYNLSQSHQYIDYVNVMAYGLTDSNGQYQNPLYKSTTAHDTINNVGKTLNTTSIKESVEIFNGYGIPNSKLIIGLAFYGIKQVKVGSSWQNSGSVKYPDIASGYLNNPNYIERYDEIAQVPYIVSKDGSEFISYDNVKSIRAKTKFVKDEGLAGLMFWEHGTDTSYTLLQGMNQAIKANNL